MPEPEVYDWCAASRRLTEAYHEVLTGGGIRSVRHRNGDEERETSFSPQNITELRKAMTEAQNKCNAQLGLCSTHRVISSGGGRKRGPYWGI